MPSSQTAVDEDTAAQASYGSEKLQPTHLRCAWLSGTWQLTKAWDVVEQQPSAAELLQLGGVARTGMRMFKGAQWLQRSQRSFSAAA